MLEDLKNVLASAGMTLDHLVQLQIYCSDVNLWETFNEVYKTFFTGPLPPRASLGAGRLLFDARFELTGIAIKDA
jgi:enamine deaminase RidA (YjgF/YER057c/UK114 family)